MEKYEVFAVYDKDSSRGNDASLRVLGFKDQNRYIFDEDQVRQIFDPLGRVFSPRFKQHCSTPENRCMILYAERNGDKYAHGNKYDSWRTSKEWKDKYCVRVPKYSSPILLGDRIIDQDALEFIFNQNEYLKDFTCRFYINGGNDLFGPFKVEKRQKIVPCQGRKITRWRTGTYELVGDDDIGYYPVREPKSSDGEVCYYVNEESIGKELNKLLNQGPLDESTVKFLQTELPKSKGDWGKILSHLFGKLIEKVMLSTESVQNFIDTSPNAEAWFNAQLEEHKETIFSSYLPELEKFKSEKTQLQQQLVTLQEKQIKAVDDLRQVVSEQDNLTTMLSLSRTQCDTLRTQIRAYETTHRHLASGWSVSKSYSINTYRSEEEPATNFTSYKERVINIAKGQTNSGFDPESFQIWLNHLRKEKLLRCGDTKWPLLLAQQSGNADCYLQTVPPTWLSYGHFERAVLEDAVGTCRANPERLVFLVLQHANASLPEAYLAPAIEAATGLRQLLPGELGAWPNNLWLFLTKDLATEEENGIGMPIKSAFLNDFKALDSSAPVSFTNRLREPCTAHFSLATFNAEQDG